MAWSPISSCAETPVVNKHCISFLLAPESVPSGTTTNITTPSNTPHRLILPHPVSISDLQASPVSTLREDGVTTADQCNLILGPTTSMTGPFTCRDCTFISNTAQELTLHVRLAHKAKPFACKVCHKTFAERGNANKHFRVAHLKQRNHKCQTCDRSFAFRDGLNRHISMVHLNQRPFECTECMCPRGPHSPLVACTHICGMRFKQKSHRRRHVLSVHHAGKRVEATRAYSSESLQMAVQQATGQVS